MDLIQVDTSLRRRASEKGMRIKKFIKPLNTRLLYSPPLKELKMPLALPDPDLEIRRGPGSSKPWGKRGVRCPKNFFRPFGHKFGLKLRRGLRPRGFLPWIHQCLGKHVHALTSLITLISPSKLFYTFQILMANEMASWFTLRSIKEILSSSQLFALDCLR